MIKSRKVYATLMSYEVSSEEKTLANKIIICFNHLLKILKICNEHLDLMHTPFKDNPGLTPEQAYKARAALRRYRDKVADNFNVLKRQSFRCFILLKQFSSDTQVSKLIKSFTLAISDVEKQVNRFIDLFRDLDDKDFGQNVVKSIDNIQKELSELKQIIEDRIIDHVQTNILAKSWVDNLSDELQEKVEEKIPLSIELVNQRNSKNTGNS
jgi:hypothetical protein